MAKDIETREDAPSPAEFESRSSSEQAEANEAIASDPQPAAPASSAGLTGHTTEASVARDSDGRVQAVHETTVVTDPESPLAVQVPEEFASQDGFVLREQPSPLEARADGVGDADPDDEPEPAD